MAAQEDIEDLVLVDLRYVKAYDVIKKINKIKNTNTKISDEQYNLIILQFVKYKKKSYLMKNNFDGLLELCQIKLPTNKQLDVIIDTYINCSECQYVQKLFDVFDYLVQLKYDFVYSNVCAMCNIGYSQHVNSFLDKTEHTTKTLLLEVIKNMHCVCDHYVCIKKYIERNNVQCDEIFLNELYEVFKNNSCYVTISYEKFLKIIGFEYSDNITTYVIKYYIHHTHNMSNCITHIISLCENNKIKSFEHMCELIKYNNEKRKHIEYRHIIIILLTLIDKLEQYDNDNYYLHVITELRYTSYNKNKNKYLQDNIKKCNLLYDKLIKKCIEKKIKLTSKTLQNSIISLSWSLYDYCVKSNVIPDNECLSSAVISQHISAFEYCTSHNIFPIKNDLFSAIKSFNIDFVKKIIDSKIIPDKECLKCIFENFGFDCRYYDEHVYMYDLEYVLEIKILQIIFNNLDIVDKSCIEMFFENDCSDLFNQIKFTNKELVYTIFHNKHMYIKQTEYDDYELYNKMFHKENYDKLIKYKKRKGLSYNTFHYDLLLEYYVLHHNDAKKEVFTAINNKIYTPTIESIIRIEDFNTRYAILKMFREYIVM